MREIVALSIAVMLFACPANAELSEEAFYPWKDVRNINTGWDYLQTDDTSLSNPDTDLVRRVDLPHTWNAFDTLDPEIGLDYRRDVSWYRKRIRFSSKERDRRLFLRFGAAGQVADVYFNGHLLGSHIGSYTAFTFEITPYIEPGRNLIAVKVNNAPDQMVPPLSGDFNIYGGLYRSVELIAAPTVHLSRKHRGGPGVRIWSPAVSAQRAKVMVSASVDNGEEQPVGLRLVAELRSPDDRVVSTAEKTVRCAGSSVEKVDIALPDVTEPRLWTPDTPTLYKLSVRLYRDGRLVDETVVHHGFRWYRFDPNTGFFLNGKPLRLRGVNRHQDFYKLGNALPPEQHIRDIEFMKEMGVNWLRLAHYPQDNFVLELCDRLGLLVWEEIPVVNSITFEEEFYTNCESQLREMIEQHFNHPSVILWGLCNEVMLRQKQDDPRRNALIERLHRVVHEQDPVRLSVIACHRSEDYARFGLTSIPDVVGYNLYFGWYYEDIPDLTPGLEKLHRLDPDKPLIVSEYGPGSELSRHTVMPGRFDFSQEWQILYHESYLDQFDNMPWLAGTNVWNMFDFGSAKRGDTVPCVNQKGILTFDRNKKDVFYLYKARWTDEPVVYILSPTWTHRTGAPDKQYRVISNCDQVELFHGRRSLGKQTSGFRWNVTLEEGKNKLVAKGIKGKRKEEHAITVNYTYMPPLGREPIRINCGGDRYTDTDGNLWLADQTCVDVEGTWGAIAGVAEYEKNVAITGSRDVPLFQTNRVGAEGYYFEVPAGRYRVRLGLYDPSFATASSSVREFDIRLEGKTVEKGWRFAGEAESRKAVWKEYETTVKGKEGLLIKFDRERYSHSIICAIEVAPI